MGGCMQIKPATITKRGKTDTDWSLVRTGTEFRRGTVPRPGELEDQGRILGADRSMRPFRIELGGTWTRARTTIW